MLNTDIRTAYLSTLNDSGYRIPKKYYCPEFFYLPEKLPKLIVNKLQLSLSVKTICICPNPHQYIPQNVHSAVSTEPQIFALKSWGVPIKTIKQMADNFLGKSLLQPPPPLVSGQAWMK